MVDKMTAVEFEDQEKLGICSKCRKVCLRSESKCDCGGETKEYWQVYEYFKPYVPIVPLVGKKVLLPEIMLFNSQELVGRCCNV